MYRANQISIAIWIPLKVCIIQESGDGKFGITWSFVACPGSGRRLSEGGRKMAVEEVAIPQGASPTPQSIQGSAFALK